MRLPPPNGYKAGTHRYRQTSTFSLFPGKFKVCDTFNPLFGKSSAYTVVKRLLDSCHFKNQIFHILPKSILQFSVNEKNPLKYTICNIKNASHLAHLLELKPLFLHYLYISFRHDDHVVNFRFSATEHFFQGEGFRHPVALTLLFQALPLVVLMQLCSRPDK